MVDFNKASLDLAIVRDMKNTFKRIRLTLRYIRLVCGFNKIFKYLIFYISGHYFLVEGELFIQANISKTS